MHTLIFFSSSFNFANRCYTIATKEHVEADVLEGFLFPVRKREEDRALALTVK